ncbi:MAG: DNA starvation/stationary phase protection protein Dps [Cyanobacteria bacterium]|nr:DNA starvation/stationary phase protection protein Dps [Cyanobacteriota bacterium]
MSNSATVTNVKAKMYPTRNDIPESVRSQVVLLLNASLATCLDLQTQLKQAHWNVKGEKFYQLHLLFDEATEEVEEFVDLIAERITALGGTAMGTARVTAKESLLPEYPLEISNGNDHLKAVADRLAIFGKQVRHSITEANTLEEADTTDLFTEISRAVDKRLWFVESHLN